MPEHSLKPISPLGADEPVVNQIGNVRISENTDCALASLSQRNDKSKPFASTAKKLFKFALPAPGESASKGEFTVWWTSPEQWFVEAPMSSHENIAARLQDSFKETASITEQSGGWARFDISGPDCVAALERICTVDSATMIKDAATRSVIEHIGVFVVCRAPQQNFSIYGPRSSAGSLHHALVTAAKSVA